jgi:hypothetical protein
LLPYVVGAGALIGIVVTARRWSRPAVLAAGPDLTIDPEVDARLDDELRNLD